MVARVCCEGIAGMNASKPTNFDELYEFHRKLAGVNPWPTTTFGGYTEKGNRIERQMDQYELEQSVRRAAAEMGWTVPEPIFETDHYEGVDG